MEAAPETTRRYQQQLRLLSRLTPEKLGLPAAFCAKQRPPSAAVDEGGSKTAASPPPYAEAVLRLQQLPQATTPERGLGCLVDTCHLVADGAADLGAPPPSADELVPLIAYVCIISRVASLPVELSLLQDLSTDAQLSGEQGYALATFQVALRWLMQLRWDELNFETAAGVASGTHQPPPNGVSRSRPSAARRAGAGARTRPAAAALAHPAIEDSMQLLRALEEELPQMRRRSSSSISSPMDSPSPAFSSPHGASSAFSSSTKRSSPEDADEGEQTGGGGGGEASTRQRELSDFGVRELLAEARRLTLDASSCVEKQELLDLLVAHQRASASAPASPQAAVPPSQTQNNSPPPSSSRGPSTPPGAGTLPKEGSSGACTPPTPPLPPRQQVTPPPTTDSPPPDAPPPAAAPHGDGQIASGRAAAATAAARAASAACSGKRLPRMGAARRGGLV